MLHEKIRVWITPALLLAGIVATAAVAQHQIADNADDIEQLQKREELLIRIDERQKAIQLNVNAIKSYLEEIRECCVDKP